jgi:hypothetical protein
MVLMSVRQQPFSRALLMEYRTMMLEKKLSASIGLKKQRRFDPVDGFGQHYTPLHVRLDGLASIPQPESNR